MIQRKRKTVRVSVDSLRRERDLAPSSDPLAYS